MLVRNLLQIINRLAPFDLAMDWDNCGLQVGSPEARVSKIGLALDANAEMVEAALSQNCDLLLTHHPFIFKPFKKIDLSCPVGLAAAKALKAGLSIVSAHTNWDAASGGVAWSLAALLELADCRPLEPSVRQWLKLVVFVPKGYEPKVRKALFEAGAGGIGDYGDCWFAAKGEAGYRVPEDGQPFIGHPGQKTSALESRLEVILPENLLAKAAAAVHGSHPYEEPAFEFYPVRTVGPNQGVGLIGRWRPARPLLQVLEEKFGTAGYRWAGPEPSNIETVAILPGSGGSYIPLAASQGAEVFITGDVSYHQALEAVDLNLTVVDLGHFETEWPSIRQLGEKVKAEAERAGFEVDCLVLPQKPVWRYRLQPQI